MRTLNDLTYSTTRWIYLKIKQLYLGWKIFQIDIPLNGKLNLEESTFFLGIHPLLNGKGLVFYDIGASVGYASSCLAKVSSIQQVYAFEPIHSVFEKLKKRMKVYPHVTCFQLALGDQADVVDIHLNKSITSSSILNTLPSHQQEFPWTMEVDTEKITVARLDDVAPEESLLPPDIIKIDVQGFELSVLAGAKRCLGQAKYCILEMSFVPLFESGPSFDDVYQAMRKENYRLIGLAGEVRGKSGRILQVDGIFENTKFAEDQNLES